MNVKIVIHSENDGYWAEVPSMPGCYTQGDTKEELIENLKEAIELWLSVDAPGKKYSGNYEVLSLAV